MDGEKGAVNPTDTTLRRFLEGQANLAEASQHVAAWATPTSRDHKDGPPCPNVPVNALLGRQVWPTPRVTANGGHGSPKRAVNHKSRLEDCAQSETIFGMGPNGSPEQTEKRGALNPEFVCWLMGYPPEWVSCAPLATRLTRKPQPLSSPQPTRPSETW